MLLTVHVNYWAVLVAAVVNMVVGALWYSPMLFSKPWSKLTGKSMEDMQKNAGVGYSVTTVGALVQSFILVNLVKDLGVTTLGKGLELGLVLWLAFVAATTVADTVFAGRSWKLWQINTGYFLVVLLINGALLSVWH